MGAIRQEIDGLLRRTRSVAVRNLKDALELVAADARLLVGRQGSRTDRSRPGEPPRRQSGALARGIKPEIDESALRGSVRSTAPHSSYIEKGTPRMAARPFLSLAWQRCRVRVAQILQRRK